MYFAKTIIFMILLSTLLFSQTDPKFETYLAAERAKLPVDGELLYNCANMGSYRFGGGSGATKKVVDADPSLPFGKIFQLSVSQTGANSWEPQFQSAANTMPLKNGDLLFYIFYIRCTESAQADGNGQAHFYVQRNSDPWTGLGSLTLTVRPEWQKYYVVAHAGDAYDTGKMEFTIHTGYFQQKIEIGGIIALNLGQGVDEHDLPTTPLYYDGMDANAAWRAEAQARIDEFRKGPLTVSVKNQNNEPIKNAVVKVEMQKHHYLFGNFISSIVLQNTSDARNYQDAMLELFNAATTPFYMGDGSWGWYRSDANKAEYKAMAEWLQDNEIPTKGHVLVWPSWTWMPPFFKELENDPDGLRNAIAEHLDTVVPVGAERGLVQWDVVNEPHVNHDVMDICGDDIMVDWYKQVHGLHPDARLILNEYNIIMNGGVAAHQDDFEYYIKLLLDNDTPLGGIGMQCHFDGNLTGIPSVLSILDRFATFNLPIQITEFDIDILDEETQANFTRDFYTAVFSHPATDKIVQWGFWEKTMWKPNGAMIRSDWSYKPNYFAYTDLVFNQWWTNEAGHTLRTGLYDTRGFLGDYKITVEFDGHTVSQNISLSKEGATVNFQIPTTETGVNDVDSHPTEYGLKQNYPNPFNASTIIEFTPSQSGEAELIIYDTRGAQVFSKKLDVTKNVHYQENFSFNHLPTGQYFYAVQFASGEQMTKKMMMIK